MSGEALRGKTLIQIASKKSRCHHLKQLLDLGFVVLSFSSNYFPLRLDPNVTTGYERRSPLELASTLDCFRMLANAGAESTNTSTSLLILLLQVSKGKKTAGPDFQEKIASLSSEEKEYVSRILKQLTQCV